MVFSNEVYCIPELKNLVDSYSTIEVDVDRYGILGRVWHTVRGRRGTYTNRRKACTRKSWFSLTSDLSSIYHGQPVDWGSRNQEHSDFCLCNDFLSVVSSSCQTFFYFQDLQTQGLLWERGHAYFLKDEYKCIPYVLVLQSKYNSLHGQKIIL